MARTVLPFVGAAVGFWIGGPAGAQVGFALGGVVGNVVDPVKNIGPRIGETGAQTTAEGAPRAIVFGTVSVTGNVIYAGALVKGDFEESAGKGGPVNVTERAFRTYAIRICEGPIEGVLKIWENDKLVYDMTAGSAMILESNRWIFGCGIYYGSEEQLPDSFLLVDPGGAENPAYRGSAYMVFVFRDLTDFRGAIPQYRYEVARHIEPGDIGGISIGPLMDQPGYMSVDSEQNPFIIRDFDAGTAIAPFQVSTPSGFYHVVTYDPDSFIGIRDTETIGNASTGPGDLRLWILAHDSETGRAISADNNSGYCEYVLYGSTVGYYLPFVGANPGWWYNEQGFSPEFGGLIWFGESVVYIGVRKTGNSSGVAYDAVYMFPTTGGGVIYPLATIANVCGSYGFGGTPLFWIHRSRAGLVRTIAYNSPGEYKTYDEDLNYLNTVSLPAAIQAMFPANFQFMGFAVDEARDMQIYVTTASTTVTIRVYDLAGNLRATRTFPTALQVYLTRVEITDTAIFIQSYNKFYRIDAPPTKRGQSMILGDIVAEIHDRCDVDASEYDVSELTDEVGGLVLAGDYTGADAINTLRGPYFFDKSEYDLKLWYPKRGAAVTETLTIDDLVDEPDNQMREQAIEYPRKFNLFYQHAGSGYAVVKATSQLSSPDVQVVGEVTVQVPVVFANAQDEAQQTVDKMHKVSWAEAEGEVNFTIPWSFLRFVPSNPIGLSLRGRINRLRITQLELHDGVIDVTARHDRQSAYTSNVTGIPIPTPTPPPATIVGSTTLLVLDIPSLRDTEDDLNIYYGVTATQPGWYGAVVQRSTDGGSTWSAVTTISSPAVIGELLAEVPDASADYTDTTNSVYVRLYRESQTLESITNTAFLSEGGAFALENADGSWEICQARDWVETSNGDFIGTTLHRGRLNTTTNAHAIGRRFVMLEGLVHVQTESSLIGQSVIHRAPSLGQAPELAAEQTATYVGRSQLEWEPASLALSRSGSNIITGSWAPRFRFGTDDAPVNSINMTGYRITIVGTSTVTFDQTTNVLSYDASALGASVVVNVQTLNRFTGPGPATSGTI